jgi:hypothetical protein
MFGCVGSPRRLKIMKKAAGKPLGGFFHAVIYGMKKWQEAGYQRLSLKITFHKLS